MYMSYMFSRQKAEMSKFKREKAEKNTFQVQGFLMPCACESQLQVTWKMQLGTWKMLFGEIFT